MLLAKTNRSSDRVETVEVTLLLIHCNAEIAVIINTTMLRKTLSHLRLECPETVYTRNMPPSRPGQCHVELRSVNASHN